MDLNLRSKFKFTLFHPTASPKIHHYPACPFRISKWARPVCFWWLWKANVMWSKLNYFWKGEILLRKKKWIWCELSSQKPKKLTKNENQSELSFYNTYIYILNMLYFVAIIFCIVHWMSLSRQHEINKRQLTTLIISIIFINESLHKAQAYIHSYLSLSHLE